ncbi:hypothetical protein OSB04_006410 [Centaurea solstitialis]|uniref:CHCH domain-containing protein n=1 Tax=Centaurea solstitialis TaxID=347529 RepID=A0AA38TUK5_9ASTR|nr:hypothetical protein OSB04_006410 [Centaurea solstitialis]
MPRRSSGVLTDHIICCLSILQEGRLGHLLVLQHAIPQHQARIRAISINKKNIPSRAPPPAPVQSSGGSMLGGIGSTIAQGMAFGGGSAVAHRAVDAVMGPRTIQHETVGVAAAADANNTVSDACGMHSKAFQDCLNSSGNDIGKCQFYMDMLSECRRNSGISA